MTDLFVSDGAVVENLAKQVDNNVNVNCPTADSAYDSKEVYDTLLAELPDADIVIPPSSDAVYNKNNHPKRNRSLQEIKTFARMEWQRVRNYGKRNYSELAIQRYKRILGNALHAREMSRQKNEAVIGCCVLNKLAEIGMPVS